MTKIQVFYALTDVSSRLFVITIPKSSTCQDLLDAINRRENSTYKIVFYHGAEVDENDEIRFYLDKDIILFVSKTPEIKPTKKFIQNIISLKDDIKYGIPTVKTKPASIISKLKTLQNNFLFLFTGSTKDHFLNGITVHLDDLETGAQYQSSLQKDLIKEKVDMQNKKLLIFSEYGSPIKSDTKIEQSSVNIVFGVLINSEITESKLEDPFIINKDKANLDDKMLISPLFESSEKGLQDMRCLIAYIISGGMKSDLLFRAFSCVMHFSPLIMSMKKMMDRCQVTNQDVVIFCSTLYTFFRSFLPISQVPNDKVFEYSLHICSLLANINNLPSSIPLGKSEIIVKKRISESLVLVLETNSVRYDMYDLKIPYYYFDPHFYKKEDKKEDLIFDIEIENIKYIENAFFIKSPFKILSPLSAPMISDYSIIKGKNSNYLYMMNERDSENNLKAKIYDPISNEIVLKDIESFALEQGNMEIEDVMSLRIPKEIIMFNVNTSLMMSADIKGFLIPPNSDKINRFEIAKKCLSNFEKYQENDNFIGLVSFNDEISLRKQLGSNLPSLEDSLNGIELKSVSKLWDSILFSINEIVQFKKNNEKFKDIPAKIIVITDEEDSNSKVNIVEIVKLLILNKIVVDCIILNTKDTCKPLCTVSHASAGLSLCFDDMNEVFSLFNQRAFIDTSLRKALSNPLIKGDRSTIPCRLKIDKINNDFINNAIENCNFDIEIINKVASMQNANVRISTPRNFISRNLTDILPSVKQRRICRELFYAMQNKDQDMIVYTFQSNFDLWKVFFKGPSGTSYENKWWYLFVRFPNDNPIQSYSFTFVSVPYHLNVSKEGRINCNFLNTKSVQSMHVIDIVYEIKKLLASPCIQTPFEIDILDAYNSNRSKYEQLAKESSQLNAKDDYKEFIGSSLIIDETNNLPDEIPDAFKDPIFYKDEKEVETFITKNKKNMFLESPDDLYD